MAGMAYISTIAVFAFTTIMVVYSYPIKAYAAETHEVEISRGSTTLGDKSYLPNPVDIAKGDTIRFVNRDSVLHTATSGDGATATLSGIFDSGYLGPNRSAEVTINETGEFSYYCQAHPTMVGLVRVSEAINGGNNEFRVTATLAGQEYEVSGTSQSQAKATQVTINPSVSVLVALEGSGEVDLTFPTSMITGISSVTTLDGENVAFSKVQESNSTTTIRLNVPSENDPSLVILGAHVVPEFGPIVFAIVASLAAITILVSRVIKIGYGGLF